MDYHKLRFRCEEVCREIRLYVGNVLDLIFGRFHF